MTGQAAFKLISVTAVASEAVLKGRLQANVTLTKLSQKPMHTKLKSFNSFPSYYFLKFYYSVLPNYALLGFSLLPNV